MRSTRLAEQDVPILIQGESGTGKELVARALHDRGRAAQGAVRRAQLRRDSRVADRQRAVRPHARRVHRRRRPIAPGVFVEADGGTLFLDEIGDMPLARAGAPAARAAGGRGAAGRRQRHACGRRPRDRGDARRSRHGGRAAAGSARISTTGSTSSSLRVPPLRERLDDLPLLAAHFLQKHGGATAADAVARGARGARRVQLAGQRARARERDPPRDRAAPRRGDRLRVAAAAHRRPAARRTCTAIPSPEDDLAVTLTEAKRRAAAEFEKRYLLRVMEKSKGSVSEGARLAGLDRTNFRRLLQRHGIDPATFKS